MLVKDIIVLACDFTENEELGKAIKNSDSLTDEQNSICDSLVKCFNLIYNEIASEYLPIIKVEKVKPVGSRVEYSTLSGDVCQILSISDCSGERLKFKAFQDYVMVDANEIEIIYQVYPSELTLSSEFDTTLTERIFAYGIAREYYFMQTLFDEADIWEERFKNSLQVLSRKKSEVKMPRRRWI